MSSESRWFWCGECGFRNHPRINGGDALREAQAKGRAKQTDTAVCEQCGTPNSHPEAVDAEPGL